MLGIAVIAGTYALRDVIRIKIASVYVRVPPKAAPPDARQTRAAGAFYADVPWALSAVPECLKQTAIARGTVEYVTGLLHAARRQPAGTTLQYRDCTIAVRALPDEILLTRGADRLRVPPASSLYRSETSLYLLRVARGRAELRTYVPAN